MPTHKPSSPAAAISFWLLALASSIESEHESRNFLKHLHNAAECDVIVCWVPQLARVPAGGGGTEQSGEF
jgi:hypothetical protein